MSWLRSAVNKAVEVGNKNSLTRTVRNYADSVVQQAGQAVAEGAKIIQDRIVPRNFQSVKVTVKRLEELSVSCTGVERIQLLRRWLVALKEIERLSAVTFDKELSTEHSHASNEDKDSPRKPSLVLYYDPDTGGEPMNFRDVFLHSQALEGIIMSMILEAPNEEEVSLLLEIFGVCLTGGKDVHNAILSSLQEMAKALANYEDEVLVKREELLELAQGAVSGLKLNADFTRIEAEASMLQQKLDGIKASKKPSRESQEKTTIATIEGLKEALAEVQLCSKLEALSVKKKSINNGDSPKAHAQKIDKLKVLSESLASSTLKAEKRISDQRLQKEEALNFRVAKSREVGEAEKDLVAEVSALEKQRDELEAELKKVEISLTAAHARLRNAREEREQFDEASNQIVAHLKTKEDELSNSMASCRIEADVVNTWIKVLEDMWVLQSSYKEQTDKRANDELEKYGEYFVTSVIDHLSAYKRDLGPSIDCIRDLAEKLKNLTEGSMMTSTSDDENLKVTQPRKKLEEEYVESEAKIVTTFSIVGSMKEQFQAQQGNISRKDDPTVIELFNAIEEIKKDFESIKRPTLEMETPISKAETPSAEKLPMSPSLPLSHSVETMTPRKVDFSEAVNQALHHPTADTEKLNSEVGKIRKNHSTDEIGDWEFD
ncbi:hypothetical protein AQUCO_02700211v1 [Aquilegia coerulea]|uniref:Uncharacterized protein n=2 Tax=Aquilegia coerulea TaxID=218851 RepID=A0A2G5D5S5_AQUCA|nr:hypothetical protein AQUCO_02700211v1 [Aquilegia coerulea]